jgi:hypothetical protein
MLNLLIIPFWSPRAGTSESAHPKDQEHQGREFIANSPLENGAFCTVFSENFHKF